MMIHLSEEARKLLLEACQDAGGLILRLTASGWGEVLKTNGRIFGDGSPTEQARWECGIRQLLRFGFVEAHGGQGRVFCVTPEGYEASHRLWGRR